jgi:hypothetical protein
MSLFRKDPPTTDQYGPWWRNASPATKIAYVFGFLEGASLGAEMAAGGSVLCDRMDEATKNCFTTEVAGLYLQAAALELDFSIYPLSEWAAQLEGIYSDPKNDAVERRSALNHVRSEGYENLSAEDKDILWQELRKKAEGS